MKTPVANTNDPAVERNISRSDMDIVIAVSDKMPELNAVPTILSTIQVLEASVVDKASEVAANTLIIQSETTTTVSNAASALASKNAAGLSEINASNSANSAAISKDNALASAVSANASAQSALNSKDSANLSAVSASASESIATTKASEASVSASDALSYKDITVSVANSITNMQVATGLPNSAVTWDGTTLTVPKGIDGIDGIDGTSIVSVIRTYGTGAAGTTDTYTITYTDNSTSTFTVYNGADGTSSGDMNKSIYDINNSGVVDNAEKVNGLTVQTAVPAGAVFTDTVYDDTGVLKDTDIDISIQRYDVNTVIDSMYVHTDNNFTNTLKAKLAGIADNANNYILPVATSTVKGGVELYSDTVQTVASNAVSTTAGRTYGVQLNSAGQAVVNVPWADTNTVYTHPTTDGSLHVPATSTTNNGKVLTAGATAGSLSWTAIPSAPVTSVAGKIGAVTLVKGDVGLGSVDNTSDSAKPISTAQQTALDTKVSKVTSTDNAIVRFDGATGQVQNSGVIIDDNGNVGIGTGTPIDKLTMYSASGNLFSRTQSGTSTLLTGVYSDGTTCVNSLGNFPLILLTNNAERMRIDTNGNVLVTSPAGLGYGAGAGGTVTQLTSKSTTVTLNKPTGQITMNNAALAAGARIQFIVNNSLVSVNTTIGVSQVDYLVNTSSYRYEVTAQANGSFIISVTNLSGISLSDSPIITFNIVKGANS